MKTLFKMDQSCPGNQHDRINAYANVIRQFRYPKSLKYIFEIFFVSRILTGTTTKSCMNTGPSAKHQDFSKACK